MRFVAIVTAFLLLSVIPIPQGKINIVVSIGSLKSIVEEICGEYASMDVIIPEGSDPHSYSLTSEDYDKIEKADLIILANSENLGIEREIREAFPDKNYLDFEDYASYGAEFHSLPGFGEKNFHGYWLYPSNALAIGRAVAEKMKFVDPEHKDYYEEAYKSFRERVLSAWEYINESLEQSSCIVAVPGVAYMAETMRMNVKGTLLKEPNSFVQGSELKKYADMMKRGEIRYVVCPEELKDTNIDKFSKEFASENDGEVIYLKIFSGKMPYDSLLYYNSAAVLRPLKESDGESLLWILATAILAVVAVLEFLIIIRWKRRLME